MYKEDILTYYAPAKKASEEKLSQQIEIFKNLPHFKDLMDVVPELFVVLNEHRQIIYANNRFLSFLGLNKEQLYGLRPGEALRCEFAHVSSGGCGTSDSCISCGAVNSILTAIIGVEDVRECSIITLDIGKDYDLRVWSKPFNHSDEIFILFAVEDISHEKRRRALERIFFHDIMNTASGIKGMAELIKENPEDILEWKDTLFNLTNRLIDEIYSQKDLADAENNELEPNFEDINSYSLISSVIQNYTYHNVARNKKISFSHGCEEIMFASDEILISRILGNMVKNALEASNDFTEVTLGCYSAASGRIEFRVHSESFIPEEVRHQVFHRSFSTKGAGRGLGTYSIKLLSEKYLRGRVWFDSFENKGTTFYASYPIRIE